MQKEQPDINSPLIIHNIKEDDIEIFSILQNKKRYPKAIKQTNIIIEQNNKTDKNPIKNKRY